MSFKLRTEYSSTARFTVRLRDIYICLSFALNSLQLDEVTWHIHPYRVV